MFILQKLYFRDAHQSRFDELVHNKFTLLRCSFTSRSPAALPVARLLTFFVFLFSVLLFLLSRTRSTQENAQKKYYFFFTWSAFNGAERK